MKIDDRNTNLTNVIFDRLCKAGWFLCYVYWSIFKIIINLDVANSDVAVQSFVKISQFYVRYKTFSFFIALAKQDFYEHNVNQFSFNIFQIIEYKYDNANGKRVHRTVQGYRTIWPPPSVEICLPVPVRPRVGQDVKSPFWWQL